MPEPLLQPLTHDHFDRGFLHLGCRACEHVATVMTDAGLPDPMAQFRPAADDFALPPITGVEMGNKASVIADAAPVTLSETLATYHRGVEHRDLARRFGVSLDLVDRLCNNIRTKQRIRRNRARQRTLDEAYGASMSRESAAEHREARRSQRLTKQADHAIAQALLDAAVDATVAKLSGNQKTQVAVAAAPPVTTVTVLAAGGFAGMGVAKCRPGDRYDPEIGIHLAYGRALINLGQELTRRGFTLDKEASKR